MNDYGKHEIEGETRRLVDRDLQWLLNRLLQVDGGRGREALVDYLANHLDANVERYRNEVRIDWLVIKLDNLGRVLTAYSNVDEPASIGPTFINGPDAIAGDT